MARKRFARFPVDASQLGEAARRPGADTRQWVSYGVVEGATEDDPDPEVVFDEQHGPLVKVTLQPSMVRVNCRVGASIAGNGEGEYHPFVAGDEVLVAIPEGDERAGCVIIARLNNAIDKFPMDSIAGQDPTTNAFGFRRCRTPRVDEFAGPYTLRSALTGALFAFDEGGALTLRDGDGSGLQMSPDVVGFVSHDGKSVMQLDLGGKHAILQVGDAILTLSATGASPEVSTLTVPGSLTIGTGGNAPGEHAISVESVVNLLAQFGKLVSPPVTTAQLVPMIAAAAAAPLDPALLGAIMDAITAQAPKVAAPPGGQPMPGICCPGLLIG